MKGKGNVWRGKERNKESKERRRQAGGGGDEKRCRSCRKIKRRIKEDLGNREKREKSQ